IVDNGRAHAVHRHTGGQRRIDYAVDRSELQRGVADGGIRGLQIVTRIERVGYAQQGGGRGQSDEGRPGDRGPGAGSSREAHRRGINTRSERERGGREGRDGRDRRGEGRLQRQRSWLQVKRDVGPVARRTGDVAVDRLRVENLRVLELADQRRIKRGVGQIGANRKTEGR